MTWPAIFAYARVHMRDDAWLALLLPAMAVLAVLWSAVL